jgi:ATP diphosphatase
MEQLAQADGTPLSTLALEQQDAYWNRAKRIERGQPD